MPDLPTGTVTLLFTDIEGSTRLLHRVGTATYAELLATHHGLMRSAIAAHDGVVVKSEGDSFFAVFRHAGGATAAAVDAQRALEATVWPRGEHVHVRMGIHTGDIALSAGEYVGIDIHRAARIAAAGHGGQVLLSERARSLTASDLPPGTTVRDLGEHQLKDIEAPERIYQLTINGGRSEFPPLQTKSARFELLPAELSSFVGRQAELARAVELVRTTRLLTLTGPGGTGKTRLALRVAKTVSDDFADGVAFVELAALTDVGLVMPTIREALGFAEVPGQTAFETLAERLDGRALLLVLDNFEQVVGAAADVAELLVALPQLTIVVTSRVPLRVTGEQELPVPPLAVPTPADATDLERLAQSDAVRLFVQRARSVRPDFVVTTENARAVAEICARLDGLPLAIELAASRVKLLPPQSLLERLGNRLDLLASTAGDRTDRQRTLRGAIDWSYELLNEPEQNLFRRLAIFVGGFRLADAEVVAVAAGVLGVDVLDGVSTLVDNSLVRPIAEEPELRFGMLETIREFGREQLERAAELDATADAHARRLVELAMMAEPHITATAEWPDRLEADHNNIRAALAWLARTDIEAAMLMGGRLWRFWHLRGHLREGAAILEELLRDPRAAARTTARAKALIGHAGLVYWLVDYPVARRDYEEALSIAREIGDSALETEAVYSLAYVRGIEGDHAGAERDFEAARQLFAEAGNDLMATWALESVGMMRTIAGRHEDALPVLEQTLARFEELGDAFGMRNALSVVARALMHLHRLDEARRINRRVIRLAHAQQDITSLSAAMHDAASLAALGGDLETAAILTGAARRIVDETGAEPPASLVNRIDAAPTLERDLDRARLDRLLADGRRLTQEEAVRLALDR